MVQYDCKFPDECKEFVVFRNDSLKAARESRLVPVSAGATKLEIVVKHAEWRLSQV